MIVRGPRAERNFTVIRNATLRDARLTFKARGLLAFILSQEPGYRISAEGLAEEGPDGRDAIRTALREMEAAGYLQREKRRTGDGRVMTDAVLYEVPRVAENPLQPATENPSPVRPAPLPETAGQTGDGFTGAGKAVANRRTIEVEELEKDYPPAAGNPLSPAVVAATPMARLDGFEEFWTAYPRKVGKGAARKVWAKAVKAAGGNPRRIVEAAATFALDPNREEAYTPHPSTWLNAERWDDAGPLPTRGRSPAAVAPRGWDGIAEARAMRGAQ